MSALFQTVDEPDGDKKIKFLGVKESKIKSLSDIFSKQRKGEVDKRISFSESYSVTLDEVSWKIIYQCICATLFAHGNYELQTITGINDIDYLNAAKFLMTNLSDITSPVWNSLS